MSLEETAVPADSGAMDPAHVASGNGPLTIRDAARSHADWNYKRQAQDETPELADEANAAPPQEAPSETTEPEPVEELPPIEAPRSWTKEEKEEFATYPREAQEKIARREQERDATIRRSQNESAEKLKGLSAKEQQVEQIRQQYESALPLLLQTLQQTRAGEFGDIRTMTDVERMAAEDWPRYVRWDAQQKKIAAAQQEVISTQERQKMEHSSQFAEFAKEQERLLVEKLPDFADKEKARAIQESALETLKSVGFDEEELVKAWSGQEKLSIRDHRVQLLVVDAARWHKAQADAAKAKAKPVPPVQVQRPGVAKAANADVTQQIQAIDKQLQNASGMKAIKLGAQRQALVRSAAR
jgi:hypothetical protein